LTGPSPGRALILRGVRIGTGGPVGSIVVTDGRVAAIAPAADPAPHAEVVDATGQTVLPGLWDAHVHMVQWASAQRRVDLSAARSAREASDLMADHNVPAGDRVIGFGFRDGLWPDRPSAELLAWAGADRIVLLVSNDLHTAWVSRAALRLLGYPEQHSGVLREHACLDAVARLAPTSQGDVDAWITDAIRAAAARGIVGFIDFEYADNVNDWRRRASVELTARVVCSIYPAYLENAIVAGLHTGDDVPGTNGLVTVGNVKIFVDGSLNTRTALCVDPYPDAEPGEDGHGVLETAPDVLEQLMTTARRHGIEPAVHAIGDRANTIALDAFDRVGCAGRIEHAQLIDHSDLPRFARPGLVLGVQPSHLIDDRDVAERHWAGRTQRAFAYADLVRAGARLEFGSDAPVAPMDPWPAVAAAVHRTGDGRPPWHPEQAIDVATALAAASRGRRTVEIGDVADLVLVDGDPADASADDLAAMPVAGTLLGGRWIFRRDG
jgi:predicted amidohydrolase YtcJ